MEQALVRQIEARIQQAGDNRFHCASCTPMGGGCINRVFRLASQHRDYMVKLNRPEFLARFQAEAEGLGALADAEGPAVPEVVHVGSSDGNAFLVLEYLAMSGRGDCEAAGRSLARLHQAHGDAFGWHTDNWIGSSTQPNRWNSDWYAFFARNRLGHQLRMAADNGHCGRLQKLGERLLERLPQQLSHNPVPSLLHGDLWSGNLGYLADGRLAIFDPAVHYGDREADLAMSELFGRLPEAFYRAYDEAYPLPPGYPLRRTLYNLYHILNHLNLFGGGYLGQSMTMMERLLGECRGD